MSCRIETEILVLSGHGKSSRSYDSSRTTILRACNVKLMRIQHESSVPGKIADFSLCDRTSALNGLFKSERTCGMLVATIYRYVNYVIPFIAAFIDRVCGKSISMTGVISKMSSEIVHWTLKGLRKLLWKHKQVRQIQNVAHNVQVLLFNRFSKYQLTDFCTEKVHIM